MDIHMPEMSGIECVRCLKPLVPEAQIMMLTVLEDHDLIFRSLAAGASGYILKKTPGAKLLEAISELHAGGAPMSGQIARKVIASKASVSPGIAPRPASSSPPPAGESRRCGSTARRWRCAH